MSLNDIDRHPVAGSPKLGAQEVASHSLFYLFASVGPALYQILIILFLTRYLSPARFGDFMLVYLALTFASMTLSAWIDHSSLRFHSVYEGKRDYKKFFSTVFASLFSLFLFLTGVILLSLFIFKGRLNPKTSELFFFGAAALPFYGIIYSGAVFLQSAIKPKAYTFLKFAFFGVSGFLGILFVRIFNGEPKGIFLGWIVAGALLLPFLFKRLSFFGNFRLPEIRKDIFIGLLRFGSPFIWTTLSWGILANVDRYLLKIFRGSAEVGIYSTGWTLANRPLVFFFYSLLAAVYPLLVRSYEVCGKKSAQEFLTRLVRYYFLSALPLVVLFSSLARHVFSLFFSSAYLSAVRLVPIIAFGTFFLGLSQYTAKGLILEKKTRSYGWLVASAAFLNCALNLLLIPFFGMAGAGISYVVSNLYLAVFAKVKADKFLPFALPMRAINRTVIASFASGAVVFFLERILPSSLLFLILKAASGIGIYLLLLIYFREIRIKNLLRLFSDIGRSAFAQGSGVL